MSRIEAFYDFIAFSHALIINAGTMILGIIVSFNHLFYTFVHFINSIRKSSKISFHYPPFSLSQNLLLVSQCFSSISLHYHLTFIVSDSFHFSVHHCNLIELNGVERQKCARVGSMDGETERKRRQKHVHYV